MLLTLLSKKWKGGGERGERKFQDIDSKIADAVDSRETKMILVFNNRESASTKSFAVKKNDHI